MGILHDIQKSTFLELVGSSKADHSRLFRKLLPNRALLLAALVASALWLPSQAFAAQTLDQAIANQLDLQCQNLTGGGAVPGLGPNLTALCNDIPSGPGSSSGGSTGSAQSLGATVENRRKDRLEGKSTENQATFNLPSGLGLFISGNVESLDRDKTTFGDGFDSTVLGTTAGADFRFNDMFLAGGAFNYVNRDGDFDGGGDFNTDSFGGLIYGSVMPIPAMFLDITLGYTSHDYDLKRPVEYVTLGGTPFGGNAKSDSDGDEFLIRAVAGYDYTIRNITVGPRVGLNYTHLSIDDYKESNAGGIGLEYDDQTVKSLQSTVGLQGSMAINTSYGVWLPQAMAEYVHEFENDRRNIKVQFVEDNRANPTKFSFNNDKPDRDFFNLGIGTVLVLPNGIQPFVDFRALVGNNRFDNYAGTVGIRIEGS